MVEQPPHCIDPVGWVGSRFNSLLVHKRKLNLQRVNNMSYHGKAVVIYDRCRTRKNRKYKSDIPSYPGLPRDSKDSKRAKFYKRCTNVIVRRSHDVPSGNAYRRYFEFWWSMY